MSSFTDINMTISFWGNAKFLLGTWQVLVVFFFFFTFIMCGLAYLLVPPEAI